MFRSRFFIWFLIIVVATFSLSVKVAEASFWSALWTAITAIVTVALVILTAGTALGLFGFSGFGLLTGGAVTFGGVDAAIITAGVACGTGLICGGSSDAPIAIISSAAGSCASDNGMRFYNSDPGSASPDDRIALYRFANPMNIAGESQTAINYKLATWMTGLAGANTRLPLGSGFYDAGPAVASAQYAHLADAGGENCAYRSGSGCADFYPPVRPSRQYIENDSGSYAQYLDYTSSGIPADGAPLQLLRYGDVCSADGECRILDQSAPPNTYVIYAAKVLRAFPNVTPSAGGAPVVLVNKFLTVTQGAPVTFPMYPYYLYEDCRHNGGGIAACRAATGPFYQGTIFAGPFRVSDLAPSSCPAPVTPAAIVGTAQVGCNFAVLSVNAMNTDTYDVVRDGSVIASGIPGDQPGYNDGSLASGQTYTYTVIPHKGSTAGNSNTWPVTTSACGSAGGPTGGGGSVAPVPTVTATLRNAACSSLELGVTTTDATTYHVFRDGAPVAVNIPATQTDYTDATVDQHTTYTYTVRAANGAAMIVDSAPLSASTLDCTPPAATVALAGTAACDAVSLAVDTQHADAYDVLRDGAVIASGIPSSTTSYSDASVSESKDYSYAIHAYRTGFAADSAPLAVTTPACPRPSASVSVAGRDCNSVDVGVAVTDGNRYDMVRDGAIIAGDISDTMTVYHDAGLARSRDYQYTVVPKNEKGLTGSANTVTGHTTCLPTCTFSANPDHIVRGETAQIRWNCARVDSCTLDGAGIAIPQGVKSVTPVTNTTYTLQCANTDGSTTTQTVVNVARPGLHEVNP